MQNGSNGSANSTGEDFLRAENLVKRFGAVSVLKGVDMHVKKGEVLGLIGDNGAGKSTLLKTITGFHRPDGGRLLVEGDEVNLRSVSQARSLGIQTVYQDLALVNELSVFHNMFLNGELTVGPFLNNRKMKEKTARYLEDMGIPSIDTEVARLSGGQRQAIAVARAVYSDAKMLLLDEPLAAMGAKEGALILDLIQRLKEERGIPMILIVHNYAQVFDVCDRVNLLRNGRIEYDKPVGETSVEELTELVVAEYRKARQGNPAEG
jgi:simple sugar transport system ATP-binding protein